MADRITDRDLDRALRRRDHEQAVSAAKANIILTAASASWHGARRAAVAVAVAISPHPTRRGLTLGRGALVAAVAAMLTTHAIVGIAVMLVYAAAAIACGKHRLRPDDSLPTVEGHEYSPPSAPVRMTPPEHAAAEPVDPPRAAERPLPGNPRPSITRH